MTTAEQLRALETLGVKPTDDVAEVRKAWRALVRTYHPDTYRGNKDAANAMLARLNAAFDTLRGYTQAHVEAARREEAALRALAAERLEAARRRSEAARRSAESARQQAARREADAARRAAQAARTAEADRAARAEDAAAEAALRAAMRDQPPAPEPERWTDSDRKAAQAARAAFTAARDMFAPSRPSRVRSRPLYA